MLAAQYKDIELGKDLKEDHVSYKQRKCLTLLLNKKPTFFSRSYDSGIIARIHREAAYQACVHNNVWYLNYFIDHCRQKNWLKYTINGLFVFSEGMKKAIHNNAANIVTFLLDFDESRDGNAIGEEHNNISLFKCFDDALAYSLEQGFYETSAVLTAHAKKHSSDKKVIFKCYDGNIKENVMQNIITFSAKNQDKKQIFLQLYSLFNDGTFAKKWHCSYAAEKNDLSGLSILYEKHSDLGNLYYEHNKEWKSALNDAIKESATLTIKFLLDIKVFEYEIEKTKHLPCPQSLSDAMVFSSIETIKLMLKKMGRRLLVPEVLDLLIKNAESRKDNFKATVLAYLQALQGFRDQNNDLLGKSLSVLTAVPKDHEDYTDLVLQIKREETQAQIAALKKIEDEKRHAAEKEKLVSTFLSTIASKESEGQSKLPAPSAPELGPAERIISLAPSASDLMDNKKPEKLATEIVKAPGGPGNPAAANVKPQENPPEAEKEGEKTVTIILKKTREEPKERLPEPVSNDEKTVTITLAKPVEEPVITTASTRQEEIEGGPFGTVHTLSQSSHTMFSNTSNIPQIISHLTKALEGTNKYPVDIYLGNELLRNQTRGIICSQLGAIVGVHPEFRRQILGILTTFTETEESRKTLTVS